MVHIKVVKLNENVALPHYMSAGAAGCDLEAFLEAPLILAPGHRAAVPTGLAIEIPFGYELQVRPRSGLAFKQGLTVVNAPGTIDSDYRGEIKVLLINLGQEQITIQSKDRIAQLVLNKVEQAVWQTSDSLNQTERSEGGFGSTGVTSAPPA
jgi:dUTP pyrophosphatase